MDFENPADGPIVVTPEDATKKAEYEKGKKIQLADGSVATVYSVQEEIETRQKSREK